MAQAPHSEVIRDLRITVVVLHKLAERAIAVQEAQQLLGNRYVILRNTGRRRRSERELDRRLVVGTSNGGRALTLVVERTGVATTWLVITGWPSTDVERRRIRGG